MPARPKLLYVSPVTPSLTGNGLAMRAGMVLEALAARFAISLLIFELYASPDKEAPPELARLCRCVRSVEPQAVGNSLRGWRRWLGPLTAYRRLAFDVVHVFRLVTWPLVRPLLEGLAPGPELHLDLDDIESVAHRRLAALCRANRDAARASFEEFEARRCEAAEEAAFQEVDCVYVCSEQDRALLAPRSRAPVRLLPNAVRLPEAPPPAPAAGAFRFLFIGTLGYYPNEDAAVYLCREIVPVVRRLSPLPVAFEIAGGRASERLREIAANSGVELLGPVPSVRPCYESAGAAVAPLRAGGGTRIKILEAFSYRRPVVSTSLGAEGLAVRDGHDILLADTPETFAEACVTLAANRPFRDRLARNALELASRSYSLDALRRRVLDTP